MIANIRCKDRWHRKDSWLKYYVFYRVLVSNPKPLSIDIVNTLIPLVSRVSSIGISPSLFNIFTIKCGVCGLFISTYKCYSFICFIAKYNSWNHFHLLNLISRLFLGKMEPVGKWLITKFLNKNTNSFLN